MSFKVSQPDLNFVFGKPWHDEFTNRRAEMVFNEPIIRIDYKAKTHLVTESIRLSAHRKLQEILNSKES
jgi:hypothetical protein